MGERTIIIIIKKQKRIFAVAEKAKKKKLKIWLALAFIAIFIGLMVFLFSGDNVLIFKSLFSEDISREELREQLSKLGVKGYVTIGVLSMLQVVFTFVPSEPVQVLSGMSFGFWKGGAICIAGVVVGNIIIYILYKIYGQKLTEYFENNVEFDFELARTSSKVTLIILILYVLPAIPYGLICFFAASLNIKFPKYILLTTIGTIPSELLGVGFGHVAITSSWIISIVVLLVLILLLVLLFKYKAAVFKKINDFMRDDNAKKGEVKDPNGLWLNTIILGSRLIVDTRVKVRLKNNVGRIERPAIVLCNHGSFLDFVYAARLLRKEKPHFVSARLYFYNRKLNKLLRGLGTIPKSMFAADMENAKSCTKVLGRGGVLVMMPEARLSTIGKFEGIQESTYKFIQRFGVTVYTIRFYGNYLANPKWGDGLRKGGLVEGELNPLFVAGETKELPLEEVQRRVDEALDYDELAWLETQPQLAFKSRTLGEGLENILYRCPNCSGESTFTAKNRSLTCEKCGLEACVDDRYGFTENKPFANFAQWYEWQNGELEKEIADNPAFALESKVELHHAGTGKGLTRVAGEGVCSLNREGLTYRGSEDGKEIEKHFPLSQIYRLLFGAGEDFEIYEGKEIWYFVPENKRTCVVWYVASGLLKKYNEK